jgi:hypothetical protein
LGKEGSVNDLGNKYAVAALREKRAKIAGEIVQLKKQLAWKQEQLANVDKTLPLFDPDCDPATIPAKRTYTRVHLFKQGELTGSILDALREAGSPLAAADVVSAVLAATGAGEAARKGMAHRVRASLQYLDRERKMVTKEGKGRAVTWALASKSSRAPLRGVSL